MTCGKCPAGRRYGAGGIWCRQYGMIIREEHECTREGWKEYEGFDDQRGESGDQAEVRLTVLSGAGEMQDVF